ncbi:hypothetical protein KC852_03395 [Candidatus Nomurabacteria bacterium]|nr:hypothetical protein [Candidatus Nomurabacteria bacterium]
MTKNKNIGSANSWILVIIFMVVIGVGVYISKNTSQEKSVMEGDSMMEDGQTNEGDTMMEDDNMMMEDKVLGAYEVYAPEKLAEADTKNVVLFFHAPWCPTCRALDADINDSLSDIPDDVLILKTDYDTNGELKKKYGVTYQHTLVQVDSAGETIAKWSGSNTLESLISNIK